MRRADIVIRWEGPDKAVREYIENCLDDLFMEMTMRVKGVTFADADATFTARIRQPKPKAKTEQSDDSKGAS